MVVIATLLLAPAGTAVPMFTPHKKDLLIPERPGTDHRALHPAQQRRPKKPQREERVQGESDEVTHHGLSPFPSAHGAGHAMARDQPPPAAKEQPTCHPAPPRIRRRRVVVMGTRASPA